MTAISGLAIPAGATLNLEEFAREQMEDTLCLNFQRVEIYFEQNDDDETLW